MAVVLARERSSEDRCHDQGDHGSKDHEISKLHFVGSHVTMGWDGDSSHAGKDEENAEHDRGPLQRAAHAQPFNEHHQSAYSSSGTTRMRCGGRTFAACVASESSIARTNRKRQPPSVRVKFVPRISMLLSLHAAPLNDGERNIDERENE